MALKLAQIIKEFSPEYWRVVSVTFTRVNGHFRAAAQINLYKNKAAASNSGNALKTCEIVLAETIPLSYLSEVVRKIYIAAKAGPPACISTENLTTAEDVLEEGQTV